MINEYVFRLIYQKGETKDIPCESVMDLVDCLLQYSQEADNQCKRIEIVHGKSFQMPCLVIDLISKK